MAGKVIDVSELLLELGLASGATEEERAVCVAALARAEGAVRGFLRYDPVIAERVEYYPQRREVRTPPVRAWDTDGTRACPVAVATGGATELQLLRLPVRKVVGLWIDHEGMAGAREGAFGLGTERAEGVDFWANYDTVDADGGLVCNDGVLRSRTPWPTDPGTIKVRYVAGYTAEELRGQGGAVDASPIAECVLREAARRAKKTLLLKKNARVGFVSGMVTSERLGDYSYSATPDNAVSAEGSLLPETMQQLSDYVNWGWCF